MLVLVDVIDVNIAVLSCFGIGPKMDVKMDCWAVDKDAMLEEELGNVLKYKTQHSTPDIVVGLGKTWEWIETLSTSINILDFARMNDADLPNFGQLLQIHPHISYVSTAPTFL